MNWMINLLRTIYYRNKLFFVLALVVLLILVVGCTTQGSGYPAPSGPVGGGCG